MVYEEEKPCKKCETCEYYEYDNWYQSERECVCPQSRMYGTNTGPYDQCDSWEKRRE